MCALAPRNNIPPNYHVPGIGYVYHSTAAASAAAVVLVLVLVLLLLLQQY